MTSEPVKTVDIPFPENELNHKWEQIDKYQVIRKSNDPRFGEIVVLKNKSALELIFSKEKWVSTKSEAEQDIEALKTRLALNYPQIQKFLGHSSAVAKQLCATNYLSCAYYQFPKSDLNKEIADRVKLGEEFSSFDLYYVAEQILKGLAFLHSKGICHGDVRPIHIGYDKEAKEVRLLDRLNDPSWLEKVQQNNLFYKKELFLSPELYQKLQGGNKQNKYSAFKNDTYALGLCLISAGNKLGIQNIYEELGVVNQSKLDEHILNFDNKYRSVDQVLCDLVRNLLHPNEDFRWGSSLDSRTKPYAEIHAQPELPLNSYAPIEGKLITVIRVDGSTYSYIERVGPSENIVFNYESNKLEYKNNPNDSMVPNKSSIVTEKRGSSITPNGNNRSKSKSQNKRESEVSNKSKSKSSIREATHENAKKTETKHKDKKESPNNSENDLKKFEQKLKDEKATPSNSETELQRIDDLLPHVVDLTPSNKKLKAEARSSLQTGKKKDVHDAKNRTSAKLTR